MSAPAPPSEASLPLQDRHGVLDHAAALILQAWQSFDRARTTQPPVEERHRELLSRPLPTAPSDPRAALDAAADVLDVSLTQARPRFFAYVASSGLEIGVLGDALMASHDVNAAVPAGGADLLDAQVLRWVDEFVGFGGARDGVMASGGAISNLTALAAARERALPGFRRTGGHGPARRPLHLRGGPLLRPARGRGPRPGADNVRRIPVDGLRRMDPAAVRGGDRRRQAGRDRPRRGRGHRRHDADGRGGRPRRARRGLRAARRVAPCRRGLRAAGRGHAVGGPSLRRAGPGGLGHGGRAQVALRPQGLQRPARPPRGHPRDDVLHHESYMPHDDEQMHPVDRTLEYSRPCGP
jgi:aromatic-L-amino-acid decarboxylase